MKYFRIGLGILAVVLAGCILLGNLVRICVRRPSELLMEAFERFDAGQTEEACALAEESYICWLSHKGLLSSLLSHETLEDATTGYMQLLGSEGEDFRSACAVLLAQMEHISEYDSLFFYNFLICCFCS